MVSSSNLGIPQMSIPLTPSITLKCSCLRILHLSLRTWRWWSVTPKQQSKHNIKSYLNKVVLALDYYSALESTDNHLHLYYRINYIEVTVFWGLFLCWSSKLFLLGRCSRKRKPVGEFPWQSGQFPPDCFSQTPSFSTFGVFQLGDCFSHNTVPSYTSWNSLIPLLPSD